jgi:hypothetical protein
MDLQRALTLMSRIMLTWELKKDKMEIKLISETNRTTLMGLKTVVIPSLAA